MKEGEVVAQYRWELPTGLDWDDLDYHGWKGSPSDVDAPVEGEFSFGSLNLEHVKIINPDDSAPIWEQTKMRVAHLGRKLGEGDGTDALMVRFVGQKVRQGLPEEELWETVNQYHDEFFDSSGYSNEETEGWLKAKIRSALYMDKRNHPDDYDESGIRIQEEKEVKQERLGRLRPVLSSDIDRLIDTLGDVEYWADPDSSRSDDNSSRWLQRAWQVVFLRSAADKLGCWETRLRALLDSEASKSLLYGLRQPK